VAVNETDSAILARPKSASRLELFPPGQQAIKIIPSARLGWGDNTGAVRLWCMANKFEVFWF